MGEHGTNPLNRLVVAIFGEPTTAIWISLAILIACGLIIVRNYRRYHAPVSEALNARIAALHPVVVAAGDDEAQVDEAQAAFVAHFDEINAAMRQGGARAEELRLAWNQFRETILDESETPMRATARAESYFLHLGDDTRILAWWANIFVALGLTFTFLGIVAALTSTVTALNAGQGQGAGAMTPALINLLQITSVKFWTSIAGVVASIILRAVDRNWHSKIERKLETIVERLDLGTLFSPAQRIAAAQLREAEEQTKTLKTFSHDLALAIGEKLEAHMAPMTAAIGGLQVHMGDALGGIQRSIDDFKSGGFDQIGREFSDALNRQAGGEMQALVGALAAMTANLQGVNDRLEGSSQAAADQIAGAARDFLTASEGIARAFATLNDRIQGMGDRIVEQGNAATERAAAHVAEERAAYQAVADGQREAARAMADELRTSSAQASEALVGAVREAVRQASEESAAGVRAALGGFAEANVGIQASFDRLQGRIAEMGDSMARSGEATAARNAELLGRAAAALEAATAQAGTGLSAAVEAAVSRASEESARVMTDAFSRFGEQFGAASAGLVDMLRQTAGRMEALAAGIDRSARAADDHATRLTQASQDTVGAATTLARAANDLQGAATPIRSATEAIGMAVSRAGEAAGRQSEAAAAHHAAVELISERLGETSASATRAWSDYRDRFVGVDQALAGALDGIKNASTEHAQHLNEQVGKLDLAMAGAVDRLSAALEPLTELADQIDDLIGRMKQAA